MSTFSTGLEGAFSAANQVQIKYRSPITKGPFPSLGFSFRKERGATALGFNGLRLTPGRDLSGSLPGNSDAARSDEFFYSKRLQ